MLHSSKLIIMSDVYVDDVSKAVEKEIDTIMRYSFRICDNTFE